MLVGRTADRGLNGTLKPITPRKRSGRKSAEYHATGAPQSCPTITAVSVPKAIEQADHVANSMEQRVPIEWFWAIGLPVASHIWCDRMEPSFCERMQLMAPRIP